jgi:hypothetical protein
VRAAKQDSCRHTDDGRGALRWGGTSEVTEATVGDAAVSCLRVLLKAEPMVGESTAKF